MSSSAYRQTPSKTDVMIPVCALTVPIFHEILYLFEPCPNAHTYAGVKHRLKEIILRPFREATFFLEVCLLQSQNGNFLEVVKGYSFQCFLKLPILICKQVQLQQGQDVSQPQQLITTILLGYTSLIHELLSFEFCSFSLQRHWETPSNWKSQLGDLKTPVPCTFTCPHPKSPVECGILASFY